MLITEDYEKIIHFLSLIEDISENFFNKVLDSLEEVFHYKNTAFFVKDISIQTPVSTKLPLQIIEEYKTSFYKKDIFSSNTPNNDHVVMISDIMPMNSYKNTAYYNDFLKRYDLDYTVNLPLIIGNQTIGGIGIHKTKACGNFSSNEISTLSIISKFIAKYLYKQNVFCQMRFQKLIYTNAFSNSSVGLLLLDQNFSVLHYNSAADNICSKFSSNSNNPFSIIIDFLTYELKSSTDKTEFFSKMNFDYKSHKFEISPITESTSILNSNKTYYSVFIIPHSHQKINTVKTAALKYKLSQRETEIINLLYKGNTNSEIASLLFISINTVKTHLNNIFNKLNVNNRIEVLHKINERV